MLALVLMDRALIHRAQNGDVQLATPRVPAQADAGAVAKWKLRNGPAHADDPDPSEA